MRRCHGTCFRLITFVLLVQSRSYRRYPGCYGWKTKDVAEQAQWVSQFREGEESLGQVVRAIMEKRDAHWEVPVQSIAGHPTFSPQPPPVRDPKKPRRTNPPKTAPLANPRKMAPRSDRRSSARWKEAMPRLQQTQMQHQGSVVCQEVSQAC
jgi:hypothetical protein